MRLSGKLWAVPVLMWGLVAGSSGQSSRVTAKEAAARMSFSGGGFLLELPVAGLAGEGSARMTVELLDPLNAVRSQGTGPCGAGSGCRAQLPAATPPGHGENTVESDLPWFRVRYTVVQDGQTVAAGILALDRIAPALFDLHVAAPQRGRPGAAYVARVRATQPLTHQPIANVALSAKLSASFFEPDKDDRDVATINVTTDASGYASIPFTLPAADDLTSVDLEVEGIVGGLHVGTEQTLVVAPGTRLDLTTDKPLYQPGQTIHTRLLLLNRAGEAAAGTKVRVDFTDPDYTLVYRTEAVTSSYGIASADWQVPAHMGLGDYSLRASVEGDSDGSQSASTRVRLSRYDLPTFVVAPKPDKPFYLPGSNAVVEVRGDYLFGKPVRRGHVRVVREDNRTWNFAKQRWEAKESQAVSGELDPQGRFLARISLDADLKQYRGETASNEFRDLHFAAYLTDASTGRTEERRFDLRLVSQSLHLFVTAEEQTRGLPQTFYLAAVTADGMPAESDVTLSLLPRAAKNDTPAKLVARAKLLKHLHTDRNGLLRLSLPEYEALQQQRPAAAGPVPDEDDETSLYLTAHDAHGHSGAISQVVSPPHALLRVGTGASLYRPGEPLTIAVDSAVRSLPVNVQVLRQTRKGAVTLASEAVTLQDGHAALTVATDARFHGVVFVLATAVGVETPKTEDTRGFCYPYCNGDQATFTASRAVLFPRDNALHVDLRMSAASYRPGEEATATLSVRGPQDPDGEEAPPAPDAVGLVAVDQAVEARNRTDNDFGGSSSSFFFRGDETSGSVLAGGFTVDALNQLDPAKPFPEGAQLAAEILLAGAHLPIETSTSASGEGPPRVFRLLTDGQLGPSRVALARYLDTHTGLPADAAGLAAILAARKIDFAALRDPWGLPYTVESTPNEGGVTQLTLKSAGPDKVQGNGDDFALNLAQWHWFNGRSRQLQDAVSGYHARTGRFLRNYADLRAEMQRNGIEVDEWRDPWGQPFLFRFEIEQTNYAIRVLTAGDPSAKPRYAYERGPYLVGGATIKYSAELDRRVQAALESYARDHAFPKTRARFDAALRAAGIAQTELVDPWHHALRVNFRSHSFFTDRVRTEAHATPGSKPQVRTTTTPVTAVEDLVELHSDGPDAPKNTRNGFLVAGFAHTRSEQSAREAKPRTPARTGVTSGPAGTLTGTVTDQTGAVVQGVKVVAKAVASGNSFEEKTDKDGRYLLSPLPAGRYTVTLDLPGFMRLVYDQVVVTAKGTLTLDATLRVATASETVAVQANAVTLETSNASVGGTISVMDFMGLAGMPAAGKVTMGVLAAPPPPPPPGATTPRLRDYFPETLLWRPEILTAADGTATVKFPVADNITAWTLSAAASTRLGNTGAGVTSFRTFQPFFAAFDPPSILTLGDRIALPVTLRNYLDHGLAVDAAIAPAPWFRLSGAAVQHLNVGSQASASPVFQFTALAPVVEAKQIFTAQSTAAGDRIARPVTVHPDGLESAVTYAGILTPGETVFPFALPADELPESAVTTLRIYPNLGARLRDALTAMLASPHGCAEQIISTAWPSLLLERSADGVPARDEALHRQTQHELEEAYANLLADRRGSGGFSYWPNEAAADPAVTAYAISFLTQAGKYVQIDEQMVKSALQYLKTQQQKDGRWVHMGRDGKPLPEDRRANAMLTASIAAMIADAPGAEAVVKPALAGLQPFVEEWDEPYTLASYTVAALAVKDSARAQAGVKRLRAMALTENGGAYWALESNTPFYGWGRAGRVETTATVLRALIAAGGGPADDLIARGVLFVNHEQDRHTLWYSSQATARVLDVLAAVALGGPTTGAAGELTVTVDREPALRVPLPPPAQDAGPIYVTVPGSLAGGAHRVLLHLPAGASSATAQLVTNFYEPWPVAPAPAAVVNHEQLRMAVAYSTTRPAVGQAVTVSAHVERIGFRGYGMMIAEIGVPPGADIDRASLETAVAASGYQVNQYEVLPDKVLLYVWPRAGGLNVKFKFTERYAIDALAAPSALWDFYNPDARVTLEPQRFTMKLP